MGIRHIAACSGNGRVEMPWGSVGIRHPLLHWGLLSLDLTRLPSGRRYVKAIKGLVDFLRDG